MNHWAADRVDRMTERWERVGATDAEIAQFADEWVNDDEWDIADKERVWALGDRRLREELLDARARDFVPTDAENDAVDRARDLIVSQEELRSAAAEAATGTVAQVLEWVGQDDARAKASIAHEERCAEPRTGLIKKLRARRASIERST